jgi:hypothetical protein
MYIGFISKRTVAVSALVLLIVGMAFAQNTMGAMTGSAMPPAATMQPPTVAAMPQSSGANSASSFVELWRKLKDSMMLSSEQTSRLAGQLESASAQLSANWDSIESFKKQAASATGDALSRYKKRIEIALEERNLIVSFVESELADYLSPEQASTIMTAAFHGVAPGHTGSMDSMGMGSDMGGMAMDSDMEMKLGDLAAALNENFRSVTIMHIIDDLKAH